MKTSAAERLAECIEELINEAKGEVHADDVSGLEDAIDERISEANADEKDADDIRGLEEFVDNRISDQVSDAVKEQLDEIDWNEKLDSQVNEAVEHEIESRLPDALRVALDSPEGRRVIELEVRKALVNILGGLIGGLIPLASPVK